MPQNQERYTFAEAMRRSKDENTFWRREAWTDSQRTVVFYVPDQPRVFYEGLSHIAPLMDDGIVDLKIMAHYLKTNGKDKVFPYAVTQQDMTCDDWYPFDPDIWNMEHQWVEEQAPEQIPA